MNTLEKYIESHGWDEAEAMDTLQIAGIISDNCVTAKDVADVDCKEAVEFLEAEE